MVNRHSLAEEAAVRVISEFVRAKRDDLHDPSLFAHNLLHDLALAGYCVASVAQDPGPTIFPPGSAQVRAFEQTGAGLREQIEKLGAAVNARRGGGRQ